MFKLLKFKYLFDRSKISFKPALISFILGIAGSFILKISIELPYGLYEELVKYRYPELQLFLSSDAMPVEFKIFDTISFICGLILIFSSFLALRRSVKALWFTRNAFWILYLWFISYYWIVGVVINGIEENGVKSLSGYGNIKDVVDLAKIRWAWIWREILYVAGAVILHVILWCRKTINLYTGESIQDPAIGDRILENLRTHGRDPRFRKSLWTSIGTHIMVIIIIPFLLDMWGCVEPYKLPLGGGSPAVQLVRVVQKKKQKKRKTFYLTPNSAIIFRIPDLDESKVIQEIDEVTQVRYQTDVNAAHGILGDGPGTTSGWQDGFKEGKLRFIRIKYKCDGWDDGMDALSRADLNFLEWFRRVSGGMKVAEETEAHEIFLLRKYPKGLEPPFMYMTGEGSFSISGRDIVILREYLIERGGMLFADCGSPQWHSSFMVFANSIFDDPNLKLRLIADDDPIFQYPFGFVNGPPPLWHHGGFKCLGIKYIDRWVVFYYPGDMNDAWKTGHSGLDPAKAEAAFQLGLNVIYHACLNHARIARKFLKPK